MWHLTISSMLWFTLNGGCPIPGMFRSLGLSVSGVGKTIRRLVFSIRVGRSEYPRFEIFATQEKGIHWRNEAEGRSPGDPLAKLAYFRILKMGVWSLSSRLIRR